MTKPSHHNLRMSYNYLRLAFKSMSKDQDEVARIIAERTEAAEAHLETLEEQLHALAQLVALKTKNLVEDAT